MFPLSLLSRVRLKTEIETSTAFDSDGACQVNSRDKVSREFSLLRSSLNCMPGFVLKPYVLLLCPYLLGFYVY